MITQGAPGNVGWRRVIVAEQQLAWAARCMDMASHSSWRHPNDLRHALQHLEVALRVLTPEEGSSGATEA